MLTPEEQAELAALETEANPQRVPAAPTRKPGDLTNLNIQVLSPEEDAELAALEQEFAQRPDYSQQNGGVLDNIGNAITAVGETVDSYTGAPTRSAVNAVLDGNNPISAFASQFGESPAKAPTGSELAKKMGVDDSTGKVITNPKTGITSRTTKSDADIVGFGIDVGADWTNALPFVNFGKVGGKLKSYLKGSAKAAEEAANTTNTLVDSAEVLKESSKEAKKSLVKLFRPDVSPDWKDYQRIAQENGVDPSLLNEAHEFGPSSLISRHARSVAEGPLGAEKLAKHEQFVKSVTDATENKIKQIGKTDRVLDNADAGALITEDWDKSVDSFFKGMGETYNTAISAAPDMRLDKKSTTILNSKLNEMESWATKRLRRNVDAEKTLNTATRKTEIGKAGKKVMDAEDSVIEAITDEGKAQAQEVLRAVKVAKNAINKSGGDLRQVYTAMRDVGDIAFKKKKSLNSIPADQRKFQEMYFTLQKGMNESIGVHLGDDFKKALEANNAAMSEFFSNRGKLDKVLGNKDLGGEEVFKKLILGGDTKQIESLFSVISPEAKNQLKASFLNNAVSRNSDGVINFKTTRNNLNKYRKDGKLKVLFQDSELQQLDEIMKLGDAAGSPVMSSSGTSAGNAFRDILSTVKNKVEGDLLVEGMKKGARKRANYVENVASSGSSQSGFARLREKSPVSKTQAAQGAKTYSIQERNEKLKRLKQIRGL